MQVYHRTHSYRFISSAALCHNHWLILWPWVLRGILQRCDFVQSLQREVSWRWRPPSISLMDWKRFTRKINKPGGRSWRTTRAHTQRHTGHFEITSPAVSNKQDNSCMCTAVPRQQRDCPNGFGCNHAASMSFDSRGAQLGAARDFGMFLFERLKSVSEKAAEKKNPSVLKTT